MKKVFHHKPTFGGDLTGAILNNANPATVTGVATSKVLNDPHDQHFRPATYPGVYGTLVIDRNGAWTYTLNEANSAVSGLATAATLTDAFKVRSMYNYRGTIGPVITITITGA